MTAKEFLFEIRNKKRLLEATIRKAEELRTLAEGVGAIRYDKDRVQTSPQDHMSEAVTELVAKEDELDRLIVDYRQTILRRVRMIEGMHDPRYVQLLTLRYIDGLRFEEIAVKMMYSWKHILRLHGEALDAFADQYEDQLDK